MPHDLIPSNSKLRTLYNSNDFAKFLEKRPEGMHHIALTVDNLQSALDYLSKQGVQLIDKSPRIGAEGYKIAFIHPGSTGGILIELCQKED